MPLKPCCLKEQFCVLRTEDLEQKDSEAQGSTVRHMLSIKRPAINTRYIAPGQHDRSPGGGGSPEEGRRQEGIKKKKKNRRRKGIKMQERENEEGGLREEKRESETEERWNNEGRSRGEKRNGNMLKKRQ